MLTHRLSKGEIIWVNLGEIKNVVGSEQAKLRPCIVIKDFPSLKVAMVLPLTSKFKSFPSVVKIDKAETGQAQDSYALCHQMRAVSHERITKSIGRITERELNKIRGVLIDIFEL